MQKDPPGGGRKRFDGGFALLLLLLGGTLAVLCREGFAPYQVFWANDLPLGVLMGESQKLPSALFACWADYYWLGSPGVVSLNLTNLGMAVFSPEIQLKFYPPATMFFLGFGAWFFFRQLRFSRAVCALGGLGAGLNMHFFSNACWGLGWWNVCCGMIFIALGILVSRDIRPLWLKAVLAGFSTGMAVMEGFDVGAILSIYVGIFLAYIYLTQPEKFTVRAGKTALAGALVVGAAAFISLSTIYTLVFTQIKGTSADGAAAPVVQTEQDKRDRWEFTTQWSIPKVESWRVLIPGLFGYRMQEFTTSTNKAGSYWGSIAEDPHIQDLESSDAQLRTNSAAELGIPQPVLEVFAGNDMIARNGYLGSIKSQLQRRHTGNGEYAGLLVCLLAAFGLANAGRKTDSPFSAEEKRIVWFWGAAAVFSLMAAWGRYGFVYRLIYQLPFLTNIRSPMKFMHALNICLIILSGYGLEVLHRCYLAKPFDKGRSLFGRWSSWWRGASGFEMKWVIGSTAAFVAALIAYWAMAGSKQDIVEHLKSNGFEDKALASQIADFSIGEVGWFALYLFISLVVLHLVFSGFCAGRRAAWGWALLAAIMICDLYRADDPWVRYYNYREKMSPNAIIDILKDKPWEHRVVSRLSPIGPYDLGETNVNFGGLSHWWLENDFPLHNIESLEIDQAPRMPALDSNYLARFSASAANPAPAARLWQLSNTRYIFAHPDWEQRLNALGWPPGSFRTVARVDIAPKTDYLHVQDAGDLTVQTNAHGALALIEFTRALPRAKLYSNWKMMQDTNAWNELMSPSFDPEKSVIVATDTPISDKPSAPASDPGEVQISHYESKHLLLDADAKTPAVLLLNDHTGDYWNAWIDQKPAAMLRCNYIMRGVFLPPGKHTVEFKYQPPQKLLHASLAAFALGVLLGGYAFVSHFARQPEASLPPASAPKSTSPDSPTPAAPKARQKKGRAR